jgi:hypothetical protein
MRVIISPLKTSREFQQGVPQDDPVTLVAVPAKACST